jgi:hypothetical protein
VSEAAETAEVWFPTGVTARRVHVPDGVPGEELVRMLDLPPPRGTLVLNGSTASLGRDVRARLAHLIVEGVAALAAAEGLTVITGATDAGIFSLLGPAMDGRQAPLVGVAPEALVSWPGMRSRAGLADLEPLEPHHSHFLLVKGHEWGDETTTMMELVGALGRIAPSVAVLCGGGTVARAEALAHVRAGRPLVVVAGSGRFADEIAARVEAGDGAAAAAADPQLAEVAGSPTLTVFPLDGEAVDLAATLRAALTLAA